VFVINRQTTLGDLTVAGIKHLITNRNESSYMFAFCQPNFSHQSITEKTTSFTLMTRSCTAT